MADTQNGGFAEYILADPDYVARILKGLYPTEAVSDICARTTTKEGIKVADVRPGECIAIFGYGDLGHMAIQYAKAMELHVCAVDIEDNKLHLAKRHGTGANPVSPDARS